MSALFSPIKLRGLALANRIMVAPMCQYSADDGAANDWHFTHINTLALSGAAMFCIEATHVEADRPHHAGLPRLVERRHRSRAEADPRRRCASIRRPRWRCSSPMPAARARAIGRGRADS